MSLFVHLNNGTLQYNNSDFLFASFNMPNLSVQDDPWQRTTDFEQRDLLDSIRQMGARTARIYAFSFPTMASDTSKHIIVTGGFGTANCQWHLNEDLMKDFDNALYLANLYGVKLIIPLIDQWQWWGGIAAFEGMLGLASSSFYTDTAVLRPQWYSFIAQILNRNNSISGILYKNDPTILAWETINEGNLNNGPPPSDWTLGTANQIKSIDTNHLVMDGTFGIYGWNSEVLQSSSVDLFSNHYYPLPFPLFYSNADIGGICALFVFSFILCIPFIIELAWMKILKKGGDLKNSLQQRKRFLLPISVILFILSFGGLLFFLLYPPLVQAYDFGARVEADLLKLKGRILIVGEMGLVPTSSMSSVFMKYPSKQVPGTLIWSLRGHSESGGFFTHQETGAYYAYHWPGFAGSTGFGIDEVSVIALLTSTTSLLPDPGVSAQALIPSLPILILQGNVNQLEFPQTTLSWKGCAGCIDYSLQVNNGTSNIITIESGLTDSKPQGSFNVEFTSPLITNGTIQVIGRSKLGSFASI